MRPTGRPLLAAALVAGLLLLVEALATPVAVAEVSPSESSYTSPRRLLLVDAAVLGNDVPLKDWSSKRTGLADVDGDGRLEILSQNENGRVYVIDTATGRALAELSTRYPYGPDLGPFNGVVAGDLDGDGLMEVVAVNRAAVVTVWRVEPGTDGGAPAFTFLWDRHLNRFHGKPSADAGAVLGDLDGDGTLEIVMQTEEKGVYALRHNGSTHWALPEWGGNAEAVLVDVDANGGLDAVFFTDGGVVYAVDGPSGRILWKYELRHRGVWPASISSPGPVGDLDGDGRVEVAACARNVENATEAYAPGAPSYRQHHFVLFMARENRSVWRAKPAWGNPLCSAYVVAHDVDGDGKKELFGMDWNTIGHKPGNWEVTGVPHVFSFTSDGRERWHASSDHGNAKPPFALADWDADGDQDVVAYGRGRLLVLDAATGAWAGDLRLSGYDLIQGPLFADLAGTGSLQVVVAATGAKPVFLIYDLGSRAVAPAWPGWSPPVPDPPGTPPVEPTPAIETEAEPEPEGEGGPLAAPSGGPPPEPSPEAPPDGHEGTREAPGPGVLLALAAAAVAAAARARRGYPMRTSSMDQPR